MIRLYGRCEGYFVVVAVQVVVVYVADVVVVVVQLLLLLGRHKGHSVLAGRENQSCIGWRQWRRRKEVQGVLQR